MVYDAASRQVLLFGGTDGYRYLNDTWLWNGRTWTPYAGPHPSGREKAVMAYDEATRQVVLFGGTASRSGLFGDYDGAPLGDTWIWNGRRWSPYSGPHPAARELAGLVYDAARRKLVLFGGTAVDPGVDNLGVPGGQTSFHDTWTWDGTRWTRHDGAAPPNRHSPNMVYDATSRQVLLYGGQDDEGSPPSSSELYDTWTWDGRRWRQHTGKAPAAVEPTMTYQANSRRVVLFSGGHFDTAATRATWSWNGQRWAKHAAAPGDPSPRNEADMVYDPDSRQSVLVGGNPAGGGSPLSDTWCWDGHKWVAGYGDLPSVSRVTSLLAYDAAAHQVVFFGANGLDTGYNAAQTWTWNGKRWTPRYPASRVGENLVYDAASRQLVMFGGATNNLDYPDDTWTWDGRGWTRRWWFGHGVGPTAREFATTVYDPVSRQVVLFGGIDGSGQYLGDTWTWDGRHWTRRTGTSPQPRSEASMVYDTARHQIVLFGGAGRTCNAAGSCSNIDLNDTWVWYGSGWIQRSSAQPPPARRDAYMVYDEAARKTVLFGGVGSSGVLNDTWTWDGHHWAASTSVDNPGERTGADMAYDPATGQVVLFGGYGSDQTSVSGTSLPPGQPEFRNDTWTWGPQRQHWTKYSGNSPPARQYASMTYDPAARELVLFGGLGTSGGVAGVGSTWLPLNDTWTWDGRRWTQRHGIAPLPRQSATMTYDAATKQIVLFGGMGEHGLLADTWTRH